MIVTATAFVPSAAWPSTDIQMLPPVDFGGNVCAGPTGGLLYWDGATAIKCVPGTTGTSNGDVGIGTTAPASQLANNSTNRLDYTGNGLSTTAINWTAAAPGYVAGFENLAVGNYYNGLLVKTADVSSNTNIIDLMSGNSSRFIVNGSGDVGIGTPNPLTTLDIQPSATDFTNAGGGILDQWLRA